MKMNEGGCGINASGARVSTYFAKVFRGELESQSIIRAVRKATKQFNRHSPGGRITSIEIRIANELVFVDICHVPYDLVEVENKGLGVHTHRPHELRGHHHRN